MKKTESKKILFIFCILLLAGTSSCKKFLATYSQNKSFVETADDLDEILVGEGYVVTNAPQFLFLMDDDVTMGRPAGVSIVFYNSGFYNWQPDPRIDSEGKVTSTDVFFNLLYKHISRANVILLNVPLLRAKNEPEDKLQRISGEAHYLRAYLYFMLMNLYGKPWQSATAAVDYGVPLKTESPIEDHFFSRSTVKQVYDQILADLFAAEKELENFNATTPKRANLASVQALLSRVLLYQGEYEKAAAYADKLITNKRYRLNDLNTFVAGTDFNTLSSPETIFTMAKPTISMVMYLQMDVPVQEFYYVSDDLNSQYTDKDLRKNAFYLANSEGNLRCVKSHNVTPTAADVSDCWLIRLPELYLNKAEALAMLGRDQEAINTIQELRKARFQPADLTTISLTGEALVNFIRNERRRELAFENHRWFDLRRYAVNSRYPHSKPIRHISYSYGPSGYFKDGYYDLNAYDQDKAAWVVPIARDEIEYNNGNLRNEDRPQRPIKH